MIVQIDEDERYPDYSLSRKSNGRYVDVPEEQVVKWVRVCAEYDIVQDEMKRYHDGNTQGANHEPL